MLLLERKITIVRCILNGGGVTWIIAPLDCGSNSVRGQIRDFDYDQEISALLVESADSVNNLLSLSWFVQHLHICTPQAPCERQRPALKKQVC